VSLEIEAPLFGHRRSRSFSSFSNSTQTQDPMAEVFGKPKSRVPAVSTGEISRRPRHRISSIGLSRFSNSSNQRARSFRSGSQARGG